VLILLKRYISTQNLLSNCYIFYVNSLHNICVTFQQDVIFILIYLGLGHVKR